MTTQEQLEKWHETNKLTDEELFEVNDLRRQFDKACFKLKIEAENERKEINLLGINHEKEKELEIKYNHLYKGLIEKFKNIELEYLNNIRK